MIYVIVIIVFIILCLYLINPTRIIFGKKKVRNKLIKLGYTVLNPHLKGIDFVATKDEKKFIIKIIFNLNNAVISINSKDYWQKIKGAVSSRKDGDKLPNAYDLVDLDLKNTNYQCYQKLHILYPDCQILTHYLNECEIEFVRPSTLLFDCLFFEYTKLEDSM